MSRRVRPDLSLRTPPRKVTGPSTETRQPYHGYYYRMLYAQGPNANGGAREYFKNGVLTEGFALVAWPADYGSSGVQTFIVNEDGVVFQKDLGRGHRYGGRSDQVVRPGHFVGGDHPDDQLIGARPDFADLSVGVGRVLDALLAPSTYGAT